MVTQKYRLHAGGQIDVLIMDVSEALDKVRLQHLVQVESRNIMEYAGRR